MLGLILIIETPRSKNQSSKPLDNLLQNKSLLTTPASERAGPQHAAGLWQDAVTLFDSVKCQGRHSQELAPG